MTEMLQLLPCVEAILIGQIAYFDGDCPEGWEELLQANGRFIISAGSYNDASEDGRIETQTFNLGDKGGEIKHKLIIDDIPSHNHFRNPDSILEAVNVHPQIGTATSNGAYQVGNQINNYQFTGYSGGNQPHNNMPPYIALKVCKLIVDPINLINYVQFPDILRFEKCEDDLKQLTSLIELQVEEYNKQFKKSNDLFNDKVLTLAGIAITSLIIAVFSLIGFIILGYRDYKKMKNQIQLKLPAVQVNALSGRNSPIGSNQLRD